jgi:hypothetical protein
MKVFRVAAVIALLTGPAYAQAPALNLLMEGEGKSSAQKAADEARDKAYKESLRKIPDAKPPADPWGSVRSGDAAKTSAPKVSAPKAAASKTSNSRTAASVKPRTKTGADTD